MRACCSSAGLGALALCSRRSLSRGRRGRTATHTPCRAALARRSSARRGPQCRRLCRKAHPCPAALCSRAARPPARGLRRLFSRMRPPARGKRAAQAPARPQPSPGARPPPRRTGLLLPQHTAACAAHALSACWWVCASARGAAAAGRARLWYGTRADAASSMCRWYTDGWLGPAPCADNCRVPASASARQQRRQPAKLRRRAL